MNPPELPSAVEETDDNIFVWRRRVPAVVQPDGSRILHEPSRICCLPGGTTSEELEQLAAFLRHRLHGPAADDRSTGVTPGGPPSSPRKRRTRKRTLTPIAA